MEKQPNSVLSVIAAAALRLLAVLTLVALVGCAGTRGPSAEQLKTLDHPPPEIEAKITGLLPRALEWYDKVEAQLLPKGRAHSAEEAGIARKLGVSRPDRVRVVVLDTFPMPDDPELKAAVERYGMGSPLAGGRSNGYVIMLKPRYADHPDILAHELVHIGQHDRMGREAFVRRYLLEMEVVGYARSPLERDAYEKQDISR